MIRAALMAAALLATAGCAGEPNWRNIEGSVGEQNISMARTEYFVSPLTPYDGIRELNDRMRAEGWGVDHVEKAGPEFPGQYLVTFRK